MIKTQGDALPFAGKRHPETPQGFIHSFVKFFTHMLWPVSCPVCGAAGEVLCGPCLSAMLRPQLPRCLWCGEYTPCKVHRGDAHEGGAKIYSASVYEGHMKDVILALKYGGYGALGGMLGRAAGGVINRPDIDALVPVPLHLKSKRRYNQAGAIAAGLGEAWGIKVMSAARWAEDIAPRAGLGASERQSLRSDAFAFGKNISGLRVGLVDDVCTTGSTLAALGKAARSGGADVVCAFAVAHVPPIN